jgi:hypothetical protein
MARKNEFSQLGKGAGDLIDGLEILNRENSPDSFNPLKDLKKGKSKKQVAKPSRIKPKDVAEKLKETKPDSMDIEEVVETPKSDEKTEVKKARKQPKTKIGEGRSKTKKPEPVSIVSNSIDDHTPSNFRSHSMLISASQLDTLRQRVYLIKASGNRRYSIKDAVYEAFEMYLSDRKELTEFPDDFITYTPSISMPQWERMNSAMYKVKASDNTKYAMKYAIFEAIQMYLQAN